ncbi:hypothetical protein [Halobacteriovorax sp. HLS]|uniref:hypothetical protein n=1 Tax=Halobacteriovorax sp. HLS TaxID=2234000 RepID=UPI0013E36E64|nr:hypothetical protein [Halobacteriovorax sp. HLS]
MIIRGRLDLLFELHELEQKISEKLELLEELGIQIDSEEVLLNKITNLKSS